MKDFSLELFEGNPKIVSSSDGGPLRRILNGRHVKPVDLYPSFKARMSVPGEAAHELGLLYHSECDAAVVHCMTQPHRVEIPVRFQRRPLIYFPDMRRELADSSIEVIETKREDDRRLKDSYYQLKLGAAEIVYKRLGWKFRRLSQDEICSGRLYENVRAIAPNAFMKVDLGTQFALEEAIAIAGGSLPLGRVLELCGGRRRVDALIVRRVITLPLSQRIDEDTAVGLVDRQALSRRSPPLL